MTADEIIALGKGIVPNSELANILDNAGHKAEAENVRFANAPETTINNAIVPTNNTDLLNRSTVDNNIPNDRINLQNPILESEVQNGERRIGYDGRGSESVLRGIREVGTMGSGGVANGVGGGEYLPTNRLLVADYLTKQRSVFDDSDLNNNTIKLTQFYDSDSSPETFSKALATAKANHPEGASVDGRDSYNISEIIRNGGKTRLVSDGTAGYAVEGDGNLTAVFKDNLNNKTPRMGGVIALSSVKDGAIKGDCFGMFLVNTYSRAGFEPVARMKYGYGYNSEMDNSIRDKISKGIIKAGEEPDVYVLKLRDGYDFNRSLSEFNNSKKYTQKELDSLPLFDDYDEMLNYRDNLIHKGMTRGYENMIPNPTTLPRQEAEPIRNIPSPQSDFIVPDMDADLAQSSERGISRTYDNYLERNGLTSSVEELRNAERQYDVRHNPEVVNDATSSLKTQEDADYWEKGYITGRNKLNSDTDVVRATLLLQDVVNKARRDSFALVTTTRYFRRRKRVTESRKKNHRKGGV